MIKRRKKYKFSLTKYYWYWDSLESIEDESIAKIRATELPDLEILRDYFSYDTATGSLFRLRDYSHKRFVEPRKVKGKIYILYDYNQVGKVLKVEDIITALTDKEILEEFEKKKSAERKLLRSRNAAIEKAKRKRNHLLIKY